MALYFGGRNGPDSSTFGGRIGSFKTALLISELCQNGAETALNFGVETPPTTALLRAESTFQNWPCQFQNDATIELKWPSMSGVEIPPNNSTFWG